MEDIFKRIFLNKSTWISNTIWLKFAPKGPIENNTALVQKMAWHRTGDKPFIWTNDGQGWWCIDESLSLNELITYLLWVTL